MTNVWAKSRREQLSQRGHIVKPAGSRKTWAIMYRDGDGNLRWEGSSTVEPTHSGG
jgi:hypothetical protein